MTAMQPIQSTPQDQMRRYAQGEIRHNSLRSAFGTYCVFPLPYALHLKAGNHVSCAENPLNNDK